MANRKLTELPTLSPINFDSADLLYIVDVQTDISKKIPYSLLAGDSLISLSAYDSQNTLNVNYLSGSIDSNTALIVALEGGEAAQGLNVAYLSGVIDLNTSDIATLSTDFNNADTATLAADVLQLSGGLDALSATVLEIEDDNEALGSFIKDYGWLIREMYCTHVCKFREGCTIAAEMSSNGDLLRNHLPKDKDKNEHEH